MSAVLSLSCQFLARMRASEDALRNGAISIPAAMIGGRFYRRRRELTPGNDEAGLIFLQAGLAVAFRLTRANPVQPVKRV